MASTELTTLLQAWRAGDQQALAQLADLVYLNLLQRARSHFAGRKGYHTLSPTSLVNETWERLIGGAQVDWESTAHFYVVASRQMRRIMIDAERRRKVRERAHAGDEWREMERIRLDGQAVFGNGKIDLLALNEALDRLEAVSPRSALIVEVRYFGGSTEEEAARIIGISVSQLKRDWNWAKTELYGMLKPNKAPDLNRPIP